MSPIIVLIRKMLHGLSILQYHYSQGIRYLKSCRIFSIHRVIPRLSPYYLLITPYKPYMIPIYYPIEGFGVLQAATAAASEVLAIFCAALPLEPGRLKAKGLRVWGFRV